MNTLTTNARRRGFTRNELLVVLTLIAVVGGILYFIWSSIPHYRRPKQAATQAKVIHGWLVTYANEHGGNFPAGDNASAAYRELFKISVGADENQFYIPGDAWHRAAPGGRPDDDAGQEPGFAQALGPGENAFAYVSGLHSSDPALLPLIANAFTSQVGVWTNDKNEKGGVFGGKYAIICRLGGSSASHDLKEGEWMVKEKSNGAGPPVNIFTPGFEGTNFTVLNPP